MTIPLALGTPKPLERVGVTANLDTNYKAPTRADQFLTIKVHLEEAKSCKSRVSSVVEDMASTLLAEVSYIFFPIPPLISPPREYHSVCSALFVQPQCAKPLNSAAVREYAWGAVAVADEGAGGAVSRGQTP